MRPRTHLVVENPNKKSAFSKYVAVDTTYWPLRTERRWHVDQLFDVTGTTVCWDVECLRLVTSVAKRSKEYGLDNSQEKLEGGGVDGAEAA